MKPENPNAKTKPRTLKRAKVAAKMLAMGQGWSVIAEKFGYKCSDNALCTLGRIPEWHQIFEQEYDKYLSEVEAEALQKQKSLLNPQGYDIKDSDKAHLEQSAAHSLLNHCAKLHKQRLQIDSKVEHSGEVQVQVVTGIERKPNAKQKTGEDTDEG